MKTFGEPASAQASVQGELFDLSPNQAGIFQRVYVEGGSTIAVEVEYPNASTGERVAVQVQDGGRLNDDAVFLVTSVDRLGTISFDFQVTNHPGIHRVSLKKGSDVKTLDFWVGRPLPVAAMLPQAP